MSTRAVLVGLVVLGVAGCGSQDTGGAIGDDVVPPTRPTTSPAGGGPTVTGGMGTPAPPPTDRLTATLTGRDEVPGPGDPDGKGTATITLSADGKVCAAITVTGIDEPKAAHVHEGAAGLAGPVFVALPVPRDATEACVTAPPEKVRAILAGPAGFYVNVHTAAFPDGAVRGQLAKP